MTGRQRQIYETAFDCCTLLKNDVPEFEEITNHPILRNESPTVTLVKTPVKTLVKVRPQNVASSSSYDLLQNSASFPSAEKRNASISKDNFSRRSFDFRASLPSAKPKRESRTEQVRAIVHAPPRSANSTPLLPHRLRHLDAATSSARSTPTHYSSIGRVKIDVPVKQMSDVSLNKQHSLLTRPSSSHFQLVKSIDSHLSSSSAKSISTSCTTASSSESVHPKSTSSESGIPGSRSSNPESQSSSEDLIETGEKLEDDPPWEFITRKKRTIPSSFSLDSGQLLSNSTVVKPLNDNAVLENDVTKVVEPTPLNLNDHAVVTNRPRPRFSLTLPLKPDHQQNSDSSEPNRKILSLSFNDQPVKRKNVLQLNFGCAALSVVAEKVDPTVPLEKQGWYHGSISRVEAENVLRVLKEGSYLVRNSDSNKQDFSLSLKSARGFMHMKIVNSNGNFVLGKFNKTFESVPDMIHHYSVNKLPIKGAEHMSLLFPVIDQLL